jgi:glutamyl-tRNA synthetase
MRTRFAPSPTGDLHLGGAWTALASWVVARRDGGAFVLRVEDLDRPRVVAGSQASIEADLRWLGLTWDEGPWLQSERTSHYEEALAVLDRKGLVYACDCSRADIARVASAPHAGEEVVYPGTCGRRDPERKMKLPPALRARVPDQVVGYEDGVLGHVEQNLARRVGDFVLRRGDGVFAYQLAVVVDDLAMGITTVIRAEDLASSTPRQIWLARQLGAERMPSYAHVPLVVASDGARLEKRTRGATIRELKRAGMAPERVIGELSAGLGLVPDNRPASAVDVLRASMGRPIAWRREPWPIPRSMAEVAG